MADSTPTDTKDTRDSKDKPRNDDNKPAHKRYYKAPTGNETYTSARREVIDFTGQIGKTQLVPGGAAGLVGKRGRGAGFYCEACDLTFKDSKQFVEHRNSVQHLLNSGEKSEVRRATADEVRARIDALVARREEELRLKTATLQDTLELRRVEMEADQEEKRERKRAARQEERAKREAEEKVKTEYGDEFRIEGEHEEEDMMKMMGITAFGQKKT